MEKADNQVKLSRGFRLFQLYALQIAMGCITAFWILSLEDVKEIFVKADWVGYYSVFFAVVVVIGVVACIFSGGIGLFHLLDAKRLLKVLEKEEQKNG